MQLILRGARWLFPKRVCRLDIICTAFAMCLARGLGVCFPGNMKTQDSFFQCSQILEGTTEQLCKSGLLYNMDFAGVTLLVSFFAFLLLHIHFVLKFKRVLKH